MSKVKPKKRGKTIKLGTVLMLKPTVVLDKLGKVQRDAIPGKIVYINWQHRFFTAEFYFNGGGHFRESFKFYVKDDVPCVVH